MGKVFIRVDDRLIHGQTIVAWCPSLSIKEIIAIDDESSKNPTLKSIMTMGVPKNYTTHIVSVEEAKEILKADSDDNRLIIIKYPERLKALGDDVLKAENIVLGNLAKREDTPHKLGGATGIFYLSDEDVEILDDIVSKGKEVLFKQLPSTQEVTWDAFKSSIK